MRQPPAEDQTKWPARYLPARHPVARISSFKQQLSLSSFPKPVIKDYSCSDFVSHSSK
jgi:hypothetical protein